MTQQPTLAKPAPSQERSRASLERLLDAAEELLKEKDFDSISIDELTRRARSSVGVFYSRFKDKEEILIALQQREVSISVESIQMVLRPEVWRVRSFLEMIRESMAVLVHDYRRRRHVMRALRARSIVYYKSPDWEPHREAMLAGLRRLAEERGHEIHHPDPFWAMCSALSMIYSLMDSLSMSPEGGPFGGIGLDDPRIEEELARMACGYLGIPYIEKSPS